jgi:hypothetical protein
MIELALTLWPSLLMLGFAVAKLAASAAQSSQSGEGVMCLPVAAHNKHVIPRLF